MKSILRVSKPSRPIQAYLYVAATIIAGVALQNFLAHRLEPTTNITASILLLVGVVAVAADHHRRSTVADPLGVDGAPPPVHVGDGAPPTAVVVPTADDSERFARNHQPDCPMIQRITSQHPDLVEESIAARGNVLGLLRVGQRWQEILTAREWRDLADDRCPHE